MKEGKALRILVVGNSWPLEPFLEQLFVGLAERGHLLLLASRKPIAAIHPRLQRLVLPREDTTLRLLASSHHLLRPLARRPRACWQILRTLRGSLSTRLAGAARLLPPLGRPIDLVYFPWNGTAIEFLPLFDVGLPTLVSCRGTQIQIAPHNPQRVALRAALPVLFEKASAIHAVSDATAAAAAVWGASPAKTTVIRPAVDLGLWQPVAEPRRSEPGTLKILAVGSLIWPKGFEDAVVALAQARQQGIAARLEIFGEGRDRERLRYTAADLGLADALILRGRASQAEIRRAMASADLFLLPSLSEGISNAALEAMAMGLPVVSTRCGGMAEVIRHRVDGWLVDPRDRAAMAEAMVTLARSPALAQTLGESARRRVAEVAHLDAQISAFEGLMRRLAA